MSLENEHTQRADAQRLREQTAREITDLKAQTRRRQDALDAANAKIDAAAARIVDLEVIRASLERDLEDITKREKPEVQTLTAEVSAYQQRVRDARERFAAAEQHLRRRREALVEIRNSQAVADYKNLVVRREKLERRLLKWKLILKDSHETLQSMEAFSAQNPHRRQTLSKTFEKCQRAKLEADEELRQLELYSELIAALLQEQNENWR
jgi:hypothetical protein